MTLSAKAEHCSMMIQGFLARSRIALGTEVGEWNTNTLPLVHPNCNVKKLRLLTKSYLYNKSVVFYENDI